MCFKNTQKLCLGLIPKLTAFMPVTVVKRFFLLFHDSLEALKITQFGTRHAPLVPTLCCQACFITTHMLMEKRSSLKALPNLSPKGL